MRDELFLKDNPAIGIVVAGYDLGLVLSFGSVLMGESRGWLADLAQISGYGLGVIGIYYVFGWLGRSVVAWNLDPIRELTADRNAGLGSVLAGYYVASGLLLHGALAGQGGGWGATLVFSALRGVPSGRRAGLRLDRGVPPP